MVRLAFFDLDGTLLTADETEISPAVREGLQCAIKLGTKICIASGRCYSSLRHLFGALSENLYFICDDGALLCRGDCFLEMKPLPSSGLKAFQNEETVYYSTPYYTLIKGANPNTEIMLRRNYYGHVRIGGEVPKRVLKIGFPKSVDTKTSRTPPEGFRVSYDRPEFEEYVSAQADKGTAAKALQRKSGIADGECIAFGDGANDIPLMMAVRQAYRKDTGDSRLRKITENTFHSPEEAVEILLQKTQE